MVATATSIALAELVEDLSLYPRHQVDDVHVQQLTLALEAGARLPPMVADRRTKIITDGWHRGRAYKRLHGPGAVVDVLFKDYKSEAAMIEDAVALNIVHGRRLDSMDQTRAALMLERAGLPKERVAVVMNMPVARVEKLIFRVARADVQTNATVPGTRKLALKRSVAHLQGMKLTEEQAKAHEMMPGTSFLLLARQLMTAIQQSMVNAEDERLRAALVELRKTLQKGGY